MCSNMKSLKILMNQNIKENNVQTEKDTQTYSSPQSTTQKTED